MFALVTAIACGTAIFSATHVLAAPGTDLSLQFLAWRRFGFDQLAHGNLALWNPHIFGGAPYFAGFQSALLYPPNWLHLVLPLARAINLLIALHVFAAGYFTYLWCRYRRASIGGSILGGMMFMLGGPFFLHVYAGHLPHISVLPWIPLILLAIDGIVASGDLKWVLLGAFAIAMQILAGHPQYVYYTGIVATLYAIASIAAHRPQPIWRPIVVFVAIYLAAAALSAVQLFPGLAIADETVRSGGLSYGLAGTFSMPPENLLTLLSPNLYGALPTPGGVFDATRQYFGRAYLWETSAFISIAGAAMAIYGASTMRDNRTRWLLIGTVLACVILALGRHTPLYWLMYRVVPKYDSFRGTAKFFALAVPFVSVLAALGFDALCDREPWDRRLAVAAAVGSLVLVLCAISVNTTKIWPAMLNQIRHARTGGDDNELFVDVPLAAYSHFGFIDLTAHAAMVALLGAALTLAIVAAIAFASRWRRELVHLVLLLAAVELLTVARGAHALASAALDVPQAWQDAIDHAPRDARFIVADPPDANSPMYFGFDGIWGYDPGVLKRYAELLTFSQGDDPSNAKQYLTWRRPSVNIFRMLRAQAVLQRSANQPVIGLSPALPTALLIRDYAVTRDRDLIFRTLASDQFDPRWQVVLERAPARLPSKGNSIGEVEIVRSTTDSLEVRANIESPAILLITNNFADGWQVASLEASAPQDEYRIDPANWTQQSIALAAGKHHLVLEYSPTSYRVGRWISLLSLVGFALGAGLVLRRRRAATQ